MMAPFLVYRLRPKGAFHFGIHGIDAEQSAGHCSSDTLYAALLTEALRGRRSFFAPPPEHTDQQPLDPPLLLSSCYPFVEEVFLLPRPNLKLPLSSVEGQKWIKNLKYVSPTIFRLIVEQQECSLDAYLPAEDKTDNAHGKLVMNKTAWIATQDGQLIEEPFWKSDSMPHVTVDRMRDSSAYYQVGQVRFAEGCGLYVLCQERIPGAADRLLELLQRVGDSGLGGRRSKGLGLFDVEGPVPLDLPSASTADRMVLLSRYRPSPAEIKANVLGPKASYDLVRVDGWLQSPDPHTKAQRRRSVRMLSEGSVVQLLPDSTAPIGTVCDVAPDYPPPFAHPVWRYGLALGITIGGAT